MFWKGLGWLFNQFRIGANQSSISLALERIKFNQFGFRATTNLYLLQFFHTNGVKSDKISLVKRIDPNEPDAEPNVTDIDQEKDVAAVEINLRPEESNIYGFRLLDEFGGYIFEQHWRRSSKARWVRIDVPKGMEIIGFHGCHDGNYIKQLGLVLWQPNPLAE